MALAASLTQLGPAAPEQLVPAAPAVRQPERYAAQPHAASAGEMVQAPVAQLRALATLLRAQAPLRQEAVARVASLRAGAPTGSVMIVVVSL
jgi:hypothetical protein